MKTKGALESDQHKDSATNLAIRSLTPDQWPALEDLFGEHGACSGCYCLSPFREARRARGVPRRSNVYHHRLTDSRSAKTPLNGCTFASSTKSLPTCVLSSSWPLMR